MSENGEFWVFGYGSLMWRPGFAFAERRIGMIRGYHRALCIYSHVHRGTPERPGLVLGLDRGGSCRGVAYRVTPDLAARTVDYLREREQVTAVYVEARVRAALDDGRHIEALTYVADRGHTQYAGRLARAELLAFVRQGRGVSGENPDYVRSTQAHLTEIGITDETLAWLAAALA